MHVCLAGLLYLRLSVVNFYQHKPRGTRVTVTLHRDKKKSFMSLLGYKKNCPTINCYIIDHCLSHNL